MPVNRNALIRYRTIDRCLTNRYRKWTLQNLIDACSDALYEYEGIDKGVSRRTVQGDIQMMRSDKLGYNAPIVVLENKYYTYEDADYSISNIPLTSEDLNRLTEVVEILKQFKGFSHFREVEGMVQKLEDKVLSEKLQQQPIIQFEKNENLKGLEHLDLIYNAILKKQALDVGYQSFRAREASSFVFHAYLLREYRNRWFMLGLRDHYDTLTTLALDRIVALESSLTPLRENNQFDLTQYYDDIVGVTHNGSRVVKVVYKVDRSNAPYVLTKPFHRSQQVVERHADGAISFSIKVIPNFELERLLLGFGESLEVLQPARLRRRMQEKFKIALTKYQQ
ncbi:MAG: WYL domain-containing protein [Bacteroidota bacterium]